jgi:hypothetical protein
MRPLIRRFIAAAVLLLASASPMAGPQPVAQEHRPAQQKPPASAEQTLYLIRSTLITLNDANRSGNYTALRDLAAPAFQLTNTAADLAVAFADLRRRNVDLFATAVIAPQLSAPPALDEQKMLRLAGYFPTHPLQIKFDLVFENVGGQWRLFGISVQTPPAPSPPPQASQAPAHDPAHQSIAAARHRAPAAR